MFDVIRDRNPKELFEFIRTIDTTDLPPLKSILGKIEIKRISVSVLIDKLRGHPEGVLLIDARSEREFEESGISHSFSFPVLNNFERHNVGLIYKKYSQSAALWLAMQYADPKTEDLKKFLERNDARSREIYVYCWRGGGRSGYLSKMIRELGYEPVVVSGGQKAFRILVNNFFNQKKFPFGVIELSGLTGCGKTELLRLVSPVLPVIDLEKSARHYSSLLGHIPYFIRGETRVSSQSAFENDIYMQIHLSKFFSNEMTFLIESESKRVGDFEIPVVMYEALESSPTIEIICSIENRVKRIVKDYFDDDLRGLPHMIARFREKEKFFRQQLSSKVYTDLMLLLESERVYEFTVIMLEKYYDRRYKKKDKRPLAVISSDDVSSAVSEIRNLFENYKNATPHI